MQAAPNKAYSVNAATAGTIDVKLPPTSSLSAGDTVSVTGTSSNTWRITQNAGQTVLTTGMTGNVAPGTSWAASTMVPKVWHWLASNAAGDVMIAGEAADGLLNTSVVGGANWINGNSPTGIWISVDASASGDRIVAVAYGMVGGDPTRSSMYMSTDRGTTWTAVMSPTVSMVNQHFESVTVSQDGQRIVAAVQNGPLYVSANGGTTWVAGTQVGGAALTEYWRAVDSSADGSFVMAVSHNGGVWVSANAGLTWTRQDVTLTAGGAVVAENWYRVKMSDNGNVIALVANSFGARVVGGTTGGTGIYLSRDRGLTWTRATSLVADYTAVAMSGDGQVISVSVSDPNPDGTGVTAAGRVLHSANGGTSFTQLTMPAGQTNWRAVAMSSDGNRLAAMTGLFQTASKGQVYTSMGNRTSAGSLGSITGGQGLTAEVQYLGNGQFNVRSSSGGAFVIR